VSGDSRCWEDRSHGTSVELLARAAGSGGADGRGVRDLITRLIEAGHWREGDPPVLVIFDAGYDVTRLSFLLGDLPAELLGRPQPERVRRRVMRVIMAQ
jgi:hypothetical protein